MKKNITFFLLTLVFGNSVSAQSTLIVEAPQNSGSSTQLRAPNGLATSAYMQACALVLQNELNYIPSGSTLTVFGFTLLNTSSISTPVTGNFTLYLQNTTDVTYLKGTTWSTIISPMTMVYASVITIPISSTSTSVTITLSTPFVYTGGGLYVGYDWYSSGPYSTTNPATFWAESLALTTGCASGVSSSGAPVLSTTNFRPSFLLGFNNPYTNDIRVSGIEAPGRIPAAINAPHNIRALIRNTSNTTVSNISVSVSVTGANTFNNVQSIPSLAAGASTYMTFAAFNPQIAGSQTVVVSVPSDQINSNNTLSWVQLVNCDTWGLNPSIGQFTYNSVGFAAASGIIATQFTTPVTPTISGLRGALSTNTPAVGNNVYGVLMSSAGGILATSNTVNITTAMLGNFINFSFPTPIPLTANTVYYFGFAQMVPGNSIAYYPAGTMYQPYVQPSLYYVTALTGGLPSALTQNFGFFGLEAIFAHTVTISVPPQTVTCGSSATLNALSSTNYSWSTGANTQSIVINTATSTSQFTVTATNTLGCLASTTASLFVSPIPVGASASPSILCLGNTVTLSASGAASYTWTTPAGQSNNTSISDAPLSNTNYTLNGSNPATGCSASTIIAIVVNPLPNINIAYTAATVCFGNGVQLTASGAAGSYTWNTGPVATAITVTPQVTTSYTALGTSAVGCINQGNVTITVNSFTPGITTPTNICQGQSIQLLATGATTVLWSTGSIFSAINVTPAATTSYSVVGKSAANGCQGAAFTTVSVNPTPSVTAVATRTSICKNEKSVLTASGAVSYSWSNGDITPSTTLIPTNTLPVTMTVTGLNADGCSGTFTINIKVNACTGLEILNQNSGFEVFPNPCSGIVTIHVTDSGTGILQLINVLGEVISVQPAVNETVFNLENQPSGIYFVVWTIGANSRQTIKLIHQ